MRSASTSLQKASHSSGRYGAGGRVADRCSWRAICSSKYDLCALQSRNLGSTVGAPEQFNLPSSQKFPEGLRHTN